jgi:SNF2 family DNA or RNA helicase
MSQEQMNKFTNYLEHGKLDKKQYQYDGVKWCVENETRLDPPGGVRGGFIADEMGLGKTIMMIGTFVANPMLRTLIVVPPILLSQWYTQIYKTTGHKVIIYYGLNKKKITQQQLEEAVIVLTTYSTFQKSGAKFEKDIKGTLVPRADCDLAPHLRKVEDLTPPLGKVEDLAPPFPKVEDLAPHLRKVEDLTPPFPKVEDLAPPLLKVEDLAPHLRKVEDLAPPLLKVEDLAQPLLKVGWNRIVFDEAHHLRNNNSRHQWAKQLKGKIRWLISGTPVQNKKRDFYNLCSVLGMASSFYTNPVNLSTIARFFILKRTKKQVGIQLPDMNIDKTVVQWANRTEFNLSQEIHSHFKFSNVKFPATQRDVVWAWGKYTLVIVVEGEADVCLSGSHDRKEGGF